MEIEYYNNKGKMIAKKIINTDKWKIEKSELGMKIVYDDYKIKYYTDKKVVDNRLRRYN